MRKTRGLRNNNPANIRKGSDKWFGLSVIQTDKEFCQFDSLFFGVRAFLVICLNYRKLYGITDIKKFLARFAPASENNLLSYVDFCFKYCGKFHLDCDADYYRFACSIFWYESKFSCNVSFVKNIADSFNIVIVPHA